MERYIMNFRKIVEGLYNDYHKQHHLKYFLEPIFNFADIYLPRVGDVATVINSNTNECRALVVTCFDSLDKLTEHLTSAQQRIVIQCEDAGDEYQESLQAVYKRTHTRLQYTHQLKDAFKVHAKTILCGKHYERNECASCKVIQSAHQDCIFKPIGDSWTRCPTDGSCLNPSCEKRHANQVRPLTPADLSEKDCFQCRQKFTSATGCFKCPACLPRFIDGK
jgi:hypothetical protein